MNLEKYLVVEIPIKHPDALVIMAGSSSERLPPAANLFKIGAAPKILLTNDGVLGGFSMEEQRNLWQVEWAELELIKLGVPEGAIIKLPFLKSGTIYDALNTASFVAGSDIRSLLIVTSDYHTRRTLWTFRQVFKDQPVSLGVYPAESSCLARENSQLDPGKLRCLMMEGGKYIYYRLRYGLVRFFLENE